MILETTVTVDRAPQQVFDYLSDFTTTREWDPGTVTTTRASGDGGVGTTYDNVSEFNGRTTELRYVVTDLRPGELIRLRGENRFVVAHDTISVTPTQSGGSEVHYRAEFAFKGWAKLAVPFLGRAFRRLADEAEQGLRTSLGRLPRA